MAKVIADIDISSITRTYVTCRHRDEQLSVPSKQLPRYNGAPIQEIRYKLGTSLEMYLMNNRIINDLYRLYLIICYVELIEEAI